MTHYGQHPICTAEAREAVLVAGGSQSEADRAGSTAAGQVR